MHNVPFHSLGISQILSYGCLFYAFAQLKIPLAAKIGVAPGEILMAVTGALLIQAFLAPLIGGWIDRFGALIVMTRGLMIGAFDITHNLNSEHNGTSMWQIKTD